MKQFILECLEGAAKAAIILFMVGVVLFMFTVFVLVGFKLLEYVVVWIYG